MKPAKLPTTPAKRKEPKPLLSSFVALFLVLISLSFSAKLTAQVNLVVNTTQCFRNLDNNPAFDEDPIPGQITVHSLLIQTGGSISYNDPGNTCSDAGNPNDGAQPVRFIVSGNMEIQSGGSINTENTFASGRGGDIFMKVGGTFTMRNGALISSSNLTASSGDRSAGNITDSVTGNVSLEPGSVIKANSQNGNGGDITIISEQGSIDIDGLVSSESISNQSGSGNNQAHGGMIWIQAKNNLLVSDDGILRSSGGDPGADLVHLCACNVTVYGLVESTGAGHAIPGNPPNHVSPPYRPDKPANSTAGVEIWAGNNIIIDGLNHHGQINADLCCGGGTTGESWIDIFAKNGDISILGNANFAVHARGIAGNTDDGGIVTIKAINGMVSASGNAVNVDGTFQGGLITVEAKKDVDLNNATFFARGFAVLNTVGGTINVQSFGSSLPAPTGSILSNVATVLDVTGAIPSNPSSGVVNLTACGTIGFPPGTIVPADVTPTKNHACDGNPSLARQPYVQFCECCTANLTIVKELHTTVVADSVWSYTVSPAINGVNSFTVQVHNGNIFGDTTFTGVQNGTYVVTEINKHFLCNGHDSLYSINGNFNLTQFSLVTTVQNCVTVADTFVNRKPNCRPNIDTCTWCTECNVRKQVNDNLGNNGCTIPDILVDVRMAHGGDNDVVTLNEIGTNSPATWSIQAAIDYVNLHGDPSPITSPGQIFIGIVATDPAPVNPADPPSCGRTCARPPSNGLQFGVENVIVRNLNSERLNLLGCSVTMKPLDPSLPVFTVQDGVGKVSIIALHVKNSNAGTGYLIKAGNAGFVEVKSSAALNNDIGFNVKDDNVEISGADHVSGNRIGILVAGTAINLRTNHDISSNSEAGIRITGNGNVTSGNEVGNSGHANATGIVINGNNNTLQDDIISYNTGDGIYVSGTNNSIKEKNASNNGLNGINADQLNGASGNRLEKNTTDKNGKQGIHACGQVDVGGNTGQTNGVTPDVQFVCTPPVYLVVDISAKKAFKYDASFNFVSSSSLNASNGNANDLADNGTNTYTLDKSTRQVFQYTGGTNTSVASKVLKDLAGGALNSPVGLAICGNDLWVADAGNKKLYKYSLSAAFSGSGNINAVQQILFTGLNGDAEGLAIDATYLYVLDQSDKVFYRYPRAGGTGVASKLMKDNAGGSLGNPSGAVLNGTFMWIVDNSTDKAYQYSLSALSFSAAGNLNATAQYSLNSLNANATGIAVGSSSNFMLRSFVPTAAAINANSLPESAMLKAYPNPFRGVVTIHYDLPSEGNVSLRIVDNFGKEIATLVHNKQKAGSYSVQWNAKDLASAVYFIHFTTDTYSGVSKLVLAK